MSAIRKLLCAGISLALLLSGTGCRYNADHVSFDSVSGDITSISGFLVDVDSQADQPKTGTRRPIIGTYTPDNREQVRELLEVNAWAAGWLEIPGTKIDDVVLKNPKNLDNDFFLTHDFYGNPDPNGQYCADYRTQLYGGRQHLSRITAIYGHSWDDDPNGTLFAQLKRYRDEDFARAHPYIFFSTARDAMAWEIFAVFDTTIHLPYIRPKLSQATFRSMMDMIEELSLYDYNVSVGYDDKILALSTCTFSVDGYPELPEYNDYRFVIMARLVEPDDQCLYTADLTANPNPLPPDATLAFKTP